MNWILIFCMSGPVILGLSAIAALVYGVRAGDSWPNPEDGDA